MDVRSTLESAAKKSLLKYAGEEESLTALYVQPDRAVFLAPASQMILKIYRQGILLRKEYEAAAKAKAVGVPVPEMIGLDMHEFAVLIMRQVPGVPLRAQNTNAAR